MTENLAEEISEKTFSEKKRELLLKKLELLSAKRRIVCEQDLLRFTQLYFSHLATHKRPEFHEEMLLLMQKSVSPEAINRLLFVAPRGFAKSTLCSVFFPLWLGLYGKKKDIFIVSATISLAKEHLRKIRKEVENNGRILSDFGEMKSDKWTEDFLVLKNGVVIRAKGRGFQIRGFRPDMIICDDLEDEEIIYSKEQRDKLEQWFFRTLLPALQVDQNLLYVGTIIHQFSLIKKLLVKEEFQNRFYKAITKEVSIWEELWSLQTLRKLRRELGTYAFEAEYQNNPISLTEQPIKPHMLHGVKIAGEKEVSVLAIDPAISEKEGSDFRAFVVFERTPEGFREIFSERGKWGIDEQMNRAVELYERFKPDRVVVEEVAFQKVYRPLLVKKGREKKLFIPVSGAVLGTKEGGRPRDKFTRLMQVAHLFEQRLVEVKNPELYDELLAFPTGDYDDLTDACVFALFWLMNFRTGKAMLKRIDQKLPIETRPSYYVKEIRPGVVVATAEAPEAKPRTNFINFDAP